MSTSLAEINVVPLVDVMLVLLIIFMVTAPMMQQGLQVNLPQARRSTPVTAQPIYVTVPADFSRTRTVQLDKDTVRIDFLQERVRQAILARDDKSVFIRADAAASVQDLATVMDKLKAARRRKGRLDDEAGRTVARARSSQRHPRSIERAKRTASSRMVLVSLTGARAADRVARSSMPASWRSVGAAPEVTPMMITLSRRAPGRTPAG